jgi:hypothetical protein
MKTLQEQIEVMQHFADGGNIERRCFDGTWVDIEDPDWSWDKSVYRIKVEVDPYAELKEAVVDPTKQVRIKGKGEWMDAGKDWVWCYRPDQYEIRDKPKPVKKVKLLAWFDGIHLFWHEENSSTCDEWKRVPAEDKVIEVEE